MSRRNAQAPRQVGAYVASRLADCCYCAGECRPGEAVLVVLDADDRIETCHVDCHVRRLVEGHTQRARRAARGGQS